MKIRCHVFAAAVGSAALITGLGCVSFFQLFRSNVETVETIETEAYCEQQVPLDKTDLDNIKMNYPDVVFSPETDSLPPIPVESDEEPEAEKQKFDPEGHFYIIREIREKIPKQFEDVHLFYIENKDNSSPDNYRKPIAPKGAVSLFRECGEAGTEYQFTRISIGGGQIEFETEKIDGVSFEFSGRFLETRNFQNLEDNYDDNGQFIHNEVLQGTLVMKRKGKVIVKASLKFGWFFEPGCAC